MGDSRTATQVLTHRGLEPSRPGFWGESSYEAFADQVRRGFGLEFDVRRLGDGTLVVTHDSNLRRLTDGRDQRELNDITWSDVTALASPKGQMATLEAVLGLVAQSAEATLSALHIKGSMQSESDLKEILDVLVASEVPPEKYILFDVKLDVALWLHKRAPFLQLAPSVAHAYDIARYNSSVHGTLLSLDTALANAKSNGGPFAWVWLDEWDRIDEKREKKDFYSEEVFLRCRDADLRIALVTPELHHVSPGLLGGEAHEDATTPEQLFARIQRILALKPDAVCTDYPEEVRRMVKSEEGPSPAAGCTALQSS